MTKAVFSPFYKPEGSAGAKRGSQYLRLASTSLGNTISVETFELQPFNSRYVLQTARTRNMYTAVTYLLVAVVVAAIALMVQSLIDPHGNLTKAIVPPSLQNAANRYRPMGEAVRERRHQAILNNAETPIVKTVHRIQDLLHLHRSDPASGQQKALVIHHDSDSSSLSTEVHDAEHVVKEHTQVKKWEELSHDERVFWQQKLSDAGMWAASEGETILKSIFFGNVAGLVGAAARGVVG
jgi:prolactin regulatory element-binding protein